MFDWGKKKKGKDFPQFGLIIKKKKKSKNKFKV